MASKKRNRGKVSRRDFLTNSVAAGIGTTTLVGAAREAEGAAPKWHRVADVVVVGAGAAGLPAAIRALDRGASVIMVDENTDIGGHAMISGGAVIIGGGTRLQKKYGIEDSADQIYVELTRPDHPITRYNDRNVVRAVADHNLELFDFLEANGVKFIDTRPVLQGRDGVPTRRRHPVERWSPDLNETINDSGGSGLVRALEKSARAKGAEILLEHRMVKFIREAPLSGRVMGITVVDLKNNSTLNIQARRAVIACTGGSSSNLTVRTIYDSRLTEEYQVGCEPYSRQSGDSEQQGMAIGASLGSTNNQRHEALLAFQKTAFIGCRYGYARWNPKSPVFAKAGAAGVSVADYQDVILVNTAGERFFDETVRDRSSQIDGRSETPGMRTLYDYFAAALSSAIVDVNGSKKRVGGPIWAIFDADAVNREKWDPKPPFVDEANGYFASGATLAELVGKLNKYKHQKYPIPADKLQETVSKYNSYVDMGKDPDFNKPAPKYKIQTPPFYAAWATPILHDTYAGLRISENFQVIDIFGKPIPGFFCAGESAGGITLHGLGKCMAGGYIAGTNATVQTGKTETKSSARR